MDITKFKALQRLVLQLDEQLDLQHKLKADRDRITVDLVRVENRIKDLSAHLIPEAAQELNVPVEAYPGEQSPTKPVLPLITR